MNFFRLTLLDKEIETLRHDLLPGAAAKKDMIVRNIQKVHLTIIHYIN